MEGSGRRDEQPVRGEPGGAGVGGGPRVSPRRAMEAFRVLPPLSGQPPPPPPRSPRVAPRYVQQKDSSAFVVLAEVGAGAPPSSPFRGRGFKGSASSRIPVKSAPTSPGPRTPKPLAGKSAPSSPSKHAPAKRFVAAKQPPSPRKPATKPAARPRFVQKTGQKDDPSRTILKKTGDIENKPVKKNNDNNDQTSNNKKSNEKTAQPVTAPSEKEARRVRQLNNTNSVSKGTSEKGSAPSATGTSLAAPRGGKAAIERAAVIMDRVNRLRPERQMINSTRTVKRNSLRSRQEATDANSKVDKNTNMATTTDLLRNVKKVTNTESKSANLEDVTQGKGEIEKISSGGMISTTEGNYLNSVDNGITQLTTNEKETERIDSQIETKTAIIDVKPQEKYTENGKANQMEATSTLSPHDNTLDSSALNSKMTNSASMNLITPSANPIGDVEDSSSTSQSSSQLTLVTGITKVNVEPVKENTVPDKTPYEVDKITSQFEESVEKNVEETVNSGDKGGVTIKADILSDVTPNGVLPTKKEAINIPNGGEKLQNKIIIMQSDKNGSVKVIGSEPVSLDLEEAIRESIVTETAVPSEDLLVRKQPDLIPSAQVEEPAVTVIGQPDLEVQAGNHTVTFR
ncbi:unnamed protein product [Nezara viridula]|uniref:Uncharacterized protein n=1 Tax=Nezara viridula TaxID=85310 RepID=A0A9P0H2X5_NEZVI|nr:unnamed protein product [Nezara viridula]